MTTVKHKKKKRKLKKVIIIIITLILVLTIVAFILFINSNFSGAAHAQNNVQTATAQTSTITTTVVGTGNLANSEALSVTIPSGLTTDEVLVEAGDTVSQGDILATFTESSVQSRITEVQTQIESLNAEIASASEDTDSVYITANVSGRVKALYVEEGDSVETVVIEKGSLMIVSLDGLMAVSFETSADLSVGDSVTVKLSDDTNKTGTVESISDGICIVTLTDNGPELDEAVTIYVNGEEIGSGTLYIHKPLGITGSYGIVESLHVGENNTISADTKLVTLTDAESLTYQALVSQREEAVEYLQELLALSQTNAITAAFDGTVESVSLSSDASVTSGSAGTASGTSGSMTGSGVSTSGSKGLSVTQLSTVESSKEESSYGEESSSVQETVENLSLADLSLVTPAANAVPQTEIKGTNYTGTIKWSPADATFKAGTDYTAQVDLIAENGYAFGTALITDTTWYPADGKVSDVALTDGVLSFNVTYSVAAATDSGTNTTDQSGGTGSSGGGSASGGSGLSSYSGTVSGSSGYSGSTGSSGTGTTGSTSSSGSDSATGTDTTGSISSTTDTSSNTKTTAFTISENNSMDLSISVDELDILNVEVGQTAAITLDAIENETYTATVTKVNTSGTSSGGVTKYTVDLSIERSGQMLSGMSASATITIQEASDIVVIPVDALQETMGSTCVYTGVDSDGTTLIDEVEVETGLSDGNYVEIVSGLSEGDEVYYIISESTDSAVLDQGSFSFDMGGGGGTGGGGMPDFDSGEAPTMGGGNMPSRE